MDIQKTSVKAGCKPNKAISAHPQVSVDISLGRRQFPPKIKRLATKTW